MGAGAGGRELKAGGRGPGAGGARGMGAGAGRGPGRGPGVRPGGGPGSETSLLQGKDPGGALRSLDFVGFPPAWGEFLSFRRFFQGFRLGRPHCMMVRLQTQHNSCERSLLRCQRVPGLLVEEQTGLRAPRIATIAQKVQCYGIPGYTIEIPWKSMLRISRVLLRFVTDFQGIVTVVLRSRWSRAVFAKLTQITRRHKNV